MSGFIQIMQGLWNFSHYLCPFPNMNNMAQTTFFTPHELISLTLIFFPWQPSPVWPALHAFILTPHFSPQTTPIPSLFPPTYEPTPQAPAMVLERSERLLRRTIFIEISTLKIMALMVFPERDEEKYIMNCLVNLIKCSFVVRPAVNQDLAKNVVIMAPTMRTPMENSDDPFLNTPYNPMEQNTSFIVEIIHRNPLKLIAKTYFRPQTNNFQVN
ncbi:hypothetical protein FXO38_10415 [Capsicum annuum]|nr:hypothetical protein FXO38_10415 [Capsicum annuum]KAF3666718.1 hypothetical protein FXO37_10381 [Capsicum annuum]